MTTAQAPAAQGAGFTIVNPDRNRLAAVAARSGLRAIKIGMRANSSYTPTRCRQVAEQFCGRKFKARDYDGMITAITAKLDALHAADQNCEAGLHSWTDAAGKLPPDTACAHCGELYGHPQ